MIPFFFLPPVVFDNVKVDPYIEIRDWFIRRINSTFSAPADANRSDWYTRGRIGATATSPGKLWSGRFEYQNVEDVYWTRAANASAENSDASLAYLNYASKNFNATAGRQKILLENQRLIGSTEWLPLSRSFDAVRAQSGQWDVWGGKLGVANTKPETARVAALTHLDHHWGTTSLILKHDVGTKADIDIQTLDHVVAASFGKTSVDLEGALQTGSNNGRDQRAWAWHAAAHEDLPLRFQASIQADAASGGSNATTVRTFDNLYPSNHNLYGLADMIAWKNMTHFALLVDNHPTKELTLRAGGHEYFLRDPSDSWYGATGTANPRSGGTFLDPTGKSGTNLGSEVDLEAIYTTRHIGSFSGGVGLFAPGPYIQNLSGHSNQMTFLYCQYQAKF